mgnify:CR=1 FL=1
MFAAAACALATASDPDTASTELVHLDRVGSADTALPVGAVGPGSVIEIAGSDIASDVSPSDCAVEW